MNKRYPVSKEMCKNCSACKLVEFTPGYGKLSEEEQYYQCIADTEDMCRETERKQVLEKLKPFANNELDGIMLYLPFYDTYFSVAFGNGTNIDVLEEGCNDYLYIVLYEYNGVDFEETDGGQLDFNTEEEQYDEDITKAVYDALRFFYDETLDFIPLHLFDH